MLGSILGGRYSDYILSSMREKNGGKTEAEARKLSPCSTQFVSLTRETALDETGEYKVVPTHDTALHCRLWMDERTTCQCRRYLRDTLCHWVLLNVSQLLDHSRVELTPLLSLYSAVYASTLAYIVDANVGRSSSAVACNSLFRGVFAFISAEIAVPLQVNKVLVISNFRATR